MTQKLPIPLFAVVLGALGAGLLAIGLVGLFGEPLLPVLGEPIVLWSMLTIGGLLLIAELVIVILALLRRSRSVR